MLGLLEIPGTNIPYAALSILVGIGGLLFGVFSFYKNHRVRRPRYATVTTTVIEGARQELTELGLTYQGEEIENFAVTRLFIWNAGRRTVKADDVATQDPIRIEAALEARILDVQKIHETNPANDVHVRLGDNGKSVAIGFEFLDKDDGASLQIVHTATSSAGLVLRGTIHGAGQFERKRIPYPSFSVVDRENPLRARRQLGILLSTGLITAVLAGTYEFYIEGNPPSILDIVSFVVLLLFVAIAFFHLFRRRVPAGFPVFESE